jgi:hypothetical protein
MEASTFHASCLYPEHRAVRLNRVDDAVPHTEDVAEVLPAGTNRQRPVPYGGSVLEGMATHINSEVAFEERDGKVYYFNGHLPVFVHEKSAQTDFLLQPPLSQVRRMFLLGFSELTSASDLPIIRSRFSMRNLPEPHMGDRSPSFDAQTNLIQHTEHHDFFRNEYRGGTSERVHSGEANTT